MTMICDWQRNREKRERTLVASPQFGMNAHAKANTQKRATYVDDGYTSEWSFFFFCYRSKSDRRETVAQESAEEKQMPSLHVVQIASIVVFEQLPFDRLQNDFLSSLDFFRMRKTD